MVSEAPTKPDFFYRQSAVIPWREAGNGREVLLITNRKRTRWVVPKGIVDPGLSPVESAQKEAWEEAGIRGQTPDEVVGVYPYQKWGGTCTVEVFVMHVEVEADDWPERDIRDRQWLPPAEAASRVREPGLAALIRGLGGSA